MREVRAPREVVFDVLTDHRGYADITPVRRAELEREGDPAPNGIGAIRVLRALGPPLREEVIAFERPRRFSYTILSGIPVRDHIGTVLLDPTPGGTLMTYTVKMIPTLPLGGAAVLGVARQAVKVLVRGVAGEAERRAAA